MRLVPLRGQGTPDDSGGRLPQSSIKDLAGGVFDLRKESEATSQNHEHPDTNGMHTTMSTGERRGNIRISLARKKALQSSWPTSS